MKPESHSYQTTLGTKTLTFESGKLAGQAGGAVTVRLGDTMVFAAATMSSEVRTNQDFFPLTVDYEERMYAGGRIPGSFFRREGRPTEEAILTARLADRPLRPLFPKDLRNDVQVILYSFSTDGENPIDILAVNAASAALMISDIPWGGPVGAVRVGRIEGEFILNPTFADIEYSDLDLRLAGTQEALIMVECGAQEVPEQVIVDALEFGHTAIQSLISVQLQMASEIGKPKRDYVPYMIEETMISSIRDRVVAPLQELFAQPYNKSLQYHAIEALQKSVITEFAGDDATKVSAVTTAFDEALKTVVRKRILEEGLRPDGRKVTEIRPIWCEIDVSPRAHGSGLFTRGETQVLTLATLGTPREAQEIDSLSPSESKRYMHHYNFPPFTTGEVKPLRGASRREIGHGALAERALLPVLPS